MLFASVSSSALLRPWTLPIPGCADERMLEIFLNGSVSDSSRSGLFSEYGSLRLSRKSKAVGKGVGGATWGHELWSEV